MQTLIRASLLFLTALPPLAPGVAHAAADTPVPPALESWVPWVMHNSRYNCPQATSLADQATRRTSADETRSCGLAGTLRLNVAANGADFSQLSLRYTNGKIELPGSSDSAWPVEVSVNGSPVAVLPGENGPVLYVAAGSARIVGRFAWAKAPERLRVPASMPLVFSKDGVDVGAPERDGDELWLGRAQSSERMADALDVQVHRLLIDGLPMQLQTEIDLRVSGEAREVTFGPALLPGFAPLTLGGDLNAKLNPDGSLSVQLRPGEWKLYLSARALTPLRELSLAPAIGAWPAEESLSFQPDATLRSVQLDGLAAVDPKQASVPAAWTNFPAYVFTPEAKLSINIDSRGRDDTAPNRLSLTREMWLAFSGDSFSTKDYLSGEMVRDWRVSMRAPYVMTRGQSPDSNGTLQPLLVTKSASGTGVEVRSTQLNLTAASRIVGTGKFPATGYDSTVERAQITLNTPPGWLLIAASGATEAPSAWLDRWNVYTAFSIALCALAGWRLGGWKLGAAVLLYAVITAFEYGAPLFWLLGLLLLALLVRQVKAPRWQLGLRIVGMLGFAVLLLQSLSFAERQARLALHPQLEFDEIGVGQSPLSYASKAAYDNDYSEKNMVNSPAPPPPPEAVTPMVADAATSADMAQTNESRSGVKLNSEGTGQVLIYPYQQKNVVSRKQMNRYAANSIVQAGAAEPNWHWQSYNIEIAGPITPEQTLHLLLMPPWLTTFMRLAALALLGFALWTVARPGPKSNLGKPLAWWQSWQREAPVASAAPASSAPAALALTLIGALLLGGPTFSAQAQATPNPQLLDELKTRLTRAPQCAPNCVAISSAQVQLNGDAFSMSVMAHVGTRSMISLPNGEGSLSNTRLTLDGSAAEFARRSEGNSELVLEAGMHVITLSGNARADRITLDFPLQPSRVQVQLTGWEAGGVRDEKLTSGTLDLVRSQRAVASDTGGKTTAQFPPYVRVLRQLRFDLEWRVETTVQRLTNVESGLTVRVPLLPGERPLGAAVQVVDGVALVPMQANESETQFSAALDLLPEIKLSAPPQADRVEVWTVESSPVWHVDFAGVPLSLTPLGSGSDDLQLRFDPLPEEVLTLKLSRPVAAPGPAYRIDAVAVETRPGARARDTTLSFTLAATQGGRHSIRLPGAAELLDVSKNGANLTLRLRDSALELPVDPGENRYIVNFREALALSTNLRLPAIDLKLPSANIRLNLELPHSRWLLWAHGPTLGPAVLYWATLIVVLLISLALAKSGRTALGFGAWALLGLGLTGFGWQAFLLVALWFLALQWRIQHGSALRDWPHRLMQIALAGLSIVALVCIVGGAMNGLLDNLDMQVVGNGSSATSLRWFADQAPGLLPGAGALTLPSWSYKALMLAWALWLAFALLRWLRYAWLAFGTGGFWRALPKVQKVVLVANKQSPLPPIPNRAENAAVNAQLHTAALEDKTALIGFARLCASSDPGVAGQSPAELEAQLNRDFAPEKIARELVDIDVEYWLAESAGKILGFVKLVQNRTAPYQKLLPATQLERLCILPSAAGLGIGTQLLKQALLQARRAGSDELWLSVYAADTAAQAIYASFGFAEKPQASNDAFKVMGKSLNE